MGLRRFAASKTINAPRSFVFHNHQRYNFRLDGLTPKFDGPDPRQCWEEVANKIDTESEGSCKEVRCIGSESSRTDGEIFFGAYSMLFWKMLRLKSS